MTWLHAAGAAVIAQTTAPASKFLMISFRFRIGEQRYGGPRRSRSVHLAGSEHARKPLSFDARQRLFGFIRWLEGRTVDRQTGKREKIQTNRARWPGAWRAGS